MVPGQPPKVRRDDADQVCRELGQRVRAARMRATLTQEEAAHRAGYGLKRWQEIEGGRHGPTVRSLVRIANALGISIWELMSQSS